MISLLSQCVNSARDIAMVSKQHSHKPGGESAKPYPSSLSLPQASGDLHIPTPLWLFDRNYGAFSGFASLAAGEKREAAAVSTLYYEIP